LIPLKLDLSNKEALIIEENLELFQKLGYDIENFGGRSFVINAAPACFGDQDLQAVIKGVIDDLILGNKPTNMQGKIEEMLTYMSCRSAIKFGQSLTISEMQGLLDQLSEQEKPYTCPHGRPTMVALEITDLAKMFGRT
jgi:DNA mismatch repair protein MutL